MEGDGKGAQQPRSPCSHRGLSGSLLEDHREPWDGREEAVVPQLRVLSQVAQWQGGGAGASRRGGEVQAGTGREGAGVDRAA